MVDTTVERTTELHFCIWSEFHELPGLRLTREQACRLWAVHSRSAVEKALQDLVDSAVLREIGPYYVRADWDQFSA